MAKLYRILKAICICAFVVSVMTAVTGVFLIKKNGLSQTTVIVTVMSGSVALTMCPIFAVICLAYSAPASPSVPAPCTHSDPPPAYRLSWGREYQKHLPSEQDGEAGTPSSTERSEEPKNIWTTMTVQFSGMNRVQSPLQVPREHTFTTGGEGAAPSTHCRCHSGSCMYSYCSEEAVWKRGVVPSTPYDLRDDQGLPSYQEAVEGI